MKLLNSLMLAGLVFANATTEHVSKFKDIIIDFYKVNPKLRGVALNLKANRAKAIDIV